MTPYQLLQLEYQRLLGEYIGNLEGILFWDIPQELRDILEKRIKYLENKEKP